MAQPSDPRAFIAAYQQSHAPADSAGLFDALKQQYGIDRYNTGAGGPSNNEVNLGGEKYKVVGAEGTPGQYWYQPGMDDSGPGGGQRAMGRSFGPDPGSVWDINNGSAALGDTGRDTNRAVLLDLMDPARQQR